MLGGKAFSNIRFEVFLRKVNVVSDDFIVIGSWLSVLQRTPILPILSFDLGTKPCLEKDDLRVVAILDGELVNIFFTFSQKRIKTCAQAAN